MGGASSKPDSKKYLIVGSTPFEEKKGRTFYNNPKYYQLDIMKIPDTFKNNSSRYFPLKLVKPYYENQGFSKAEVAYNTESVKKFLDKYKNIFDTIIFDNSVIKMFDTYSHDDIQLLISQLISILKPGGKLIVDSTEPGQYSFNYRKNEAAKEASKQQQKEEFLKSFQINVPYEIKTYNELIATEPAAAAVYGPLIGAGAAAGAGGVGWEVKGTHEAIVFTKPAVAGGGRRSCTKKSRSKQRKTRSLRSMHFK